MNPKSVSERQEAVSSFRRVSEMIRIFEENGFRFTGLAHRCRAGEKIQGLFATVCNSGNLRSETEIGLTYDEGGECRETIVIAERADRNNRIVLTRNGGARRWLYALHFGARTKWFEGLLRKMSIRPDSAEGEGLLYSTTDGFVIAFPEMLLAVG